ncbi:MAG: type IV toxin-antitoxin system AbiEi family antitoxin domain-containing protein [Sphaerochaeta sp.]|nr:type IV toxin-antitoxin system AbiEi family antitoxin domain-containing protein [Sphaerochaeta sp.]
MTRKSLDSLLPEGQLVNRDWLSTRGFDRSSVDYFIRAGKLEAAAHGIYRKPGPPLKWQNVIYSLGQMGFDIHVGHISALCFHGFEHFPMLGGVKELLVYSSVRIPSWVDTVSNVSFTQIHRSPFLEGLVLGLEEIPYGTWDWPIPYATPERAFIEFLSTVSSEVDIGGALLRLELAFSLRPDLIQELLEECKQIKAKRLFLWLARELDHSWFKHIDQSRIDLGSGKRQIVIGGKLDEEFLITVPRGLFDELKEPIF